MFFTIFIIVLVTIYISLISFIKSELTDFTYIYGLILADTLFLNQEMPRITGLSRLWAIISLFALIIFYNTNNKNTKYFIFIFIILLTTIIWAAQSRGTLICYFLLIIFITLFNIKKIIKKVLYIISFIFVPIIIYTLFISTSAISDKNSINLDNSSSAISDKNSINLDNSSNVNIYKDIIYKSRVIDNKTSSGRLEIWSDIFNKYDKTRFFGYGPQADRNLIGRELTEKFSNNASNLYIYAFTCGGYIAMIIFLIINIQIIKNLYQVVFERRLFL
jgi:hypothetical protein